MKSLSILFLLLISSSAFSQNPLNTKGESREIMDLISSYSQARETNDTVLLREILVEDVDQLVSSGVWRKGIDEAVKGMMESSAENPGERSLKLESIRFLNPDVAIVDAHYEIKNSSGTVRKMWSTFLVVTETEQWKISAIRNMLPAGN
ncbi:SgcJ/EcaC family oxidoreductase [Algoriphagus halophytocola]|uniref:SgcJ/EcaC family oxidoreductase n=1 Tax=Algoriphagus halophytocola TaxID=2991499 RepID=A0ABY6ML52_9BACT|nr:MULTISPECIES: SgcJ/EcaC family oxidoreductase [unclassified Algoriphagus]UZD24503.1 SgcJ/EcaC family oxidoreductase [Algoriphagus sp. TR-M5]WBL41867.1 SgcJ/EcaC family oxidoreductase [Algoriphagus sp. TR-M9]